MGSIPCGSIFSFWVGKMDRQGTGCLLVFLIFFLIAPYYFISSFFSLLFRSYNKNPMTEEEWRWRKASTVGIFLLMAFALFVYWKVSV